MNSNNKLQQLYNWCEGEKKKIDLYKYDELAYPSYHKGQEKGFNNALSTVQEKIKEMME